MFSLVTVCIIAGISLAGGFFFGWLVFSYGQQLGVGKFIVNDLAPDHLRIFPEQFSQKMIVYEDEHQIDIVLLNDSN